MIRLSSLAALCLLLINPMARAQEPKEPALLKTGDTSKCNLEIGIRHNGHIDFFKHPKIGLPGGPMMPPTSRLSNALRGKEHYYFEGLGLSKEQGFFTYRLWVDYFNYRRIEDREYSDTTVFEGYQRFTSGIRFSPGFEKEWRWKFMGFSIGMEVPVYFQTKRKEITHLYDYNQPDREMRIWTHNYDNGFQSVGLTAIAGVDYNIPWAFVDFPANDYSPKDLDITIIDDGTLEGSEFACLEISIFTGDGIIGGDDNHKLIIIDNEVGIDEKLSTNQIKVSPNPAYDFISIENIGKAKISKMTITDVLGKRVMELFSFMNKRIDIKKLNPGIYFINFYSDDNVITTKLLKE